jgi:putative ABC transport system ATP-binding protein
MTIRFEKMIPLPMLEQDTTGSEIWESEAVLFEQGKSYLIEAPSGRGKTSLLAVIYGIRRDYQGVVFMDDKPVSLFSWKEWSKLRKRNLSYIFQGLELFESLTARENILLKNSITGFQPLHRIEEMAQTLGIEEFMDRKAGILSFGQQQRVAIIRALCQPYNFLLADECFSHMDHRNSQNAYQLIHEECTAQGAGMLLTTLNDTGSFKVEKRMRL